MPRPFGKANAAIRVGGVIVVPILVQLGGLTMYAAIRVAMAGYVLTGIIGTRGALSRQ